MKIYTKTGDKGMTSLVGGERVFKTDLRVEAYGTVDELMALVALLADRLRPLSSLGDCVTFLDGVNRQLMSLSALLAVGEGGEGKVAPLATEVIEQLEEQIDRMQAQVPPITKFTIPGGNELFSLCHLCRTVCRRAERAALRAAAQYPLDAGALCYLNRLSDALYALGRLLCVRLGVEEILWLPNGK